MAIVLSPENKGRSDTWPIFGRLLRMLRPWRGKIILALIFLFLSMPGEVFPAIAWMFVIDDIVLQKPDNPWIYAWFSFGGSIHSRYLLLLSAVAWMFIVYAFSELGGIIDT